MNCRPFSCLSASMLLKKSNRRNYDIANWIFLKIYLEEGHSYFSTLSSGRRRRARTARRRRSARAAARRPHPSPRMRVARECIQCISSAFLALPRQIVFPLTKLLRNTKHFSCLHAVPCIQQMSYMYTCPTHIHVYIYNLYTGPLGKWIDKIIIGRKMFI